MLNVVLHNVVGSGDVGRPIPLDVVAKWDGAIYQPEAFPTVRLRLGGGTAQLFGSGKIVVVGAKSEDAVYGVLDDVFGRLQKSGIPTADTISEIHNVVATTKLERTLDPRVVVMSVPKSMYEPAHFPGVIIRRQHPKCAILLFAAGKMVCVGANSAKAAKDAVNQLHAELVEVGLV